MAREFDPLGRSIVKNVYFWGNWNELKDVHLGPSTLRVKNLAQIKEGEVTFGDFTLLVGPQASGKSIFLQMLKFNIDREHISSVLEINGYDWSGDDTKLLSLVFGEGMGQMVLEGTEISFGNEFMDAFRLKKGKQERKEQLFYVIAQRVVTMQLGWPRAFGAYEIGDPYVMKSFSETLRRLMEKEGSINGNSAEVFPKLDRIQAPLQALIDSRIFYGAKVELDNSTLKKRFLLSVAGTKLPFMTWSAGQKEFMPLLLSFYHLMPQSNGAMRDAIKWVVIEEPEMGLHPQAIQSLMVVFLELIARGYKVVISTHSPVLLELAWAMRFIQAHGGGSKEVFELFGLPEGEGLEATFQAAVKDKTFNTYYFDRQVDGVHIKDISSLDPGSEDIAEADWGGLTAFASRAGAVVAKLAANE